MNTLFKQNKTWISSAHQGCVNGKMHPNTLPAYLLAAQKGADMIETDARMTKDGVLIANHDGEINGFDKDGNPVQYIISDTDFSTIEKVRLSKDDAYGPQYIPSLQQTLELTYYTGMRINVDLKEGLAHAADVARLVVDNGMRGRTVYATNGAGTEAIKLILEIDPGAKFIDTKTNFTRRVLCEINDYQSKCYVYTKDFSSANISEIRESGCMLAAISLNEENAAAAFKYHPDMAEYPHTSDFSKIDRQIIDTLNIIMPQ